MSIETKLRARRRELRHGRVETWDREWDHEKGELKPNFVKTCENFLDTEHNYHTIFATTTREIRVIDVEEI
jgi:hypothetical protein